MRAFREYGQSRAQGDEQGSQRVPLGLPLIAASASQYTGTSLGPFQSSTSTNPALSLLDAHARIMKTRQTNLQLKQELARRIVMDNQLQQFRQMQQLQQQQQQRQQQQQQQLLLLLLLLTDRTTGLYLSLT